MTDPGPRPVAQDPSSTGIYQPIPKLEEDKLGHMYMLREIHPVQNLRITGRRIECPQI